MPRIAKYIQTMLLCFFTSSLIFAQSTSLNNAIARFRDQALLTHASVGICLKDLQSGKIVGETEPQVSLTPASIQKVITGATALEILGPDFRFSTRFGYSGELKNDTLWGDLIILGGGDPALGSMYFREHYFNPHFEDVWIKALSDAGIRVVTGNLITDATIFDDQLIPGTWMWEDMGNYYGAGACGLTVYDNQYEIHLQSPKDAGLPTKIIRTDPEIPGLTFDNRVLSDNSNSDGASVYGSPFDLHRVLLGTIPKDRPDFTIKASIPDPADFLALEMQKKLKQSKITLSGEIRNGKAGREFIPLAEIQSPRLIEIIDEMEKTSVNLFAEHLLKYLGYLQNGQGTTAGGIKFITGFWQAKGIGNEGFFMNDGSGLSPTNGVTPEIMTAILKYMKTQSPYAIQFYNALPSPGNGTLTAFNPGNFPHGALRAKSGSMTRVRCYAGYLTTVSGNELAFAIMLNNFSCRQSEAAKAIEDFLKEIRLIY